jgi:hypothetical protein
MYIDSNMVFGLPAITNSNTATISTNVFDAGSAVKLFASPKIAKCCFRIAVTADASPSILVDLVGDSAAALTTAPVVIASSGVIASDEDGTTLASGDTVDCAFDVTGQTAAKRYYGLFVTLGGTNPDIVAAASQGYIALDYQTMLPGARQAVPA